jgi:23S rRNA U2552 (ribose-2'-O)-methylase RlmE/FtsJ
VIDLLPRLLKPGGRAVVKVFMDAGYRDNRARFEACFAEVKATRAEAARRGSAELYLLGRSFAPPPAACG